MRQKWLIYKKVNTYFELSKNIAIIYLGVNIALLSLEYFQPRIYQMFIDDVLIKSNLNQIKFVILLYAIYFVSKTIFKYANEYVSFRIHSSIIKKTKVKMFSNLFHRDFAYYDTNSSGDIQINIENDTEFLKDFVDIYIVNYFLNYVSLIVATVLCFRLSLQLACVALITIPLTIIADKVVGANEKKVIDQIRENDEIKVTWMNNTLNNWKEVKALCLEKTIIRKYLSFLHVHIILNAKKMYFFVARYLIIPWIKEKFFMQILMFLIGGLLVINNMMTVGGLLVFIIYYGMLSKAISTISSANAEFMIKSGIIDKVTSQLNYVPEKKIEFIQNESSDIEFKDVSFRYSEDSKYTLQNINMKINKGDRIAVCGKSGSGKTTIARMIAGFYEPTQGEIYYSGVDIKQLSKEYLYKKVGYIRQDSVLFNASIRENLLIANENASDELIDIACKKALIYEYIQSLPEGYQTIIDEMGDNLSGGLKQRLILARQFLKDTEVYIFDEVTSNLDRHSEDYIYKIIGNMDENKTIIYITHHYLDNMYFNKILNVEEGKIKVSIN